MENFLTKRQKELLNIIYKYIKTTGYPPSFEEMKEGLNVCSNQSVVDHLSQLEKKKVLKRNEGTARSLTILPLGYQTLDKPALVVLRGTSSAGTPVETIEITGEWQPVADSAAKLSDETFLLKISGDSMINAGIDDGDLILVKSQKEFVSGDIVLAQTADGSTVKRFISEDKPPYLYLKPENPKYNIIYFTEDVALTGKIISVIKNGQWRPVK
jgi:repressor LexA